MKLNKNIALIIFLFTATVFCQEINTTRDATSIIDTNNSKISRILFLIDSTIINKFKFDTTQSVSDTISSDSTLNKFIRIADSIRFHFISEIKVPQIHESIIEKSNNSNIVKKEITKAIILMNSHLLTKYFIKELVEVKLKPDTVFFMHDSSKIITDTTSIFFRKDVTKKDEQDTTKTSIITPPLTLENIFSLKKIIWAIIFFIIGYYILKLITTLLTKISEKSIKYRIFFKGLIPIIRILGWTAILSIIVIGIFAPPIETIILITGSFGIALGFSAQDILKNIFGGIMILFDRPFQVGDKIQAGGYYGEVISIGLRSTKIITPDDSKVSIPNGEVMMQSISNVNSGEANCQVVAEIFLPININTDEVRKIALKAAQVSRYVYLNKPIVVNFKNEMYEQRPVLKMRLKAYVLDIRYEFQFMSEMTEITLKELFDRKLLNKDSFLGLE
ncbi:MAG: mechanosensitive ion channel [Ignavibacteriales bacterium]|nr:mechanosensitive ion channel [Ignavibacteriales bacterium]